MDGVVLIQFILGAALVAVCYYVGRHVGRAQSYREDLEYLEKLRDELAALNYAATSDIPPAGTVRCEVRIPEGVGPVELKAMLDKAIRDTFASFGYEAGILEDTLN